MKISFLSDLHIGEPSGAEQVLFDRFCENPYTEDATHVILLGDMFDLLVGEHKEYLERYSTFFNNILNLLERGKSVIYLEGNHDFHFKSTLLSYIEMNAQYPKNFKYMNRGENIKLDDKTYHFCHGYEVDYENQAFKRWFNTYSSSPFKFLVNKLLPFSAIDYIGARASENSKKRGSKTFDLKKAKAKYIAGAKSFIDEIKVDGVICGHTHIQENHQYPDGTVYLNCGFPKNDKNFLHYSDGEFRFVNLAES